MLYGSKTGFVLLEADAVVFFAAENNFHMLNNTNERAHAVACRSIVEALCANGIRWTPFLFIANLFPLGFLSGKSLFISEHRQVGLLCFVHFDLILTCFSMMLFLKVVVTAAEAAPVERSMDPLFVLNIALLWRICPVAAVGRT